MNRGKVAIALGLVVVAVILQSSLFGDRGIQPFGASPNLVLVTVIASVRYLAPEPGLLLGFTAGLLMDLLGGSPLGLWALAMTLVAYLTLRLRDRADEGPIAIAIGVAALSVVGTSMYAFAATLFGQRVFADPGALKLILLPAAYNVVLAAIVVPLATKLLRTDSVGSWQS